MRPDLRTRDDGPWLAGAVLVAFGVALGIAPYHTRTAAGSSSAAALSGYDNVLAYWLVVGIGLAVVAGLAVASRRGAVSIPAGGWPERHEGLPGRRRNRGALLLVAVASALLYCPFFLARYGPYREDSYFLTALHRMQGGQIPYIDFESLYGPLMLYVPHAWMEVVGYSMTSYFGFLALLEVATMIWLLTIVQRNVQGRLSRLVAFGVMAVFLIDVLLGPSSNGLRKLFALQALLMVSAKPDSVPTALAAGTLIGLGAAYSHDFGAVALLASSSIYVLSFTRSRSWASLVPVAVISMTAVAAWFLISLSVLGSAMPAYLTHAVAGASQFAREASFAFFWTGHSLAAFGTLAVALVIVGVGLGRSRTEPLESGDRLMFGGLVFAVVALRSGLNRADMWHLAAPVLPLILAFLLPWPARVFALSARMRQIAGTLIVVQMVTYGLGLLPPADYMLSGWLRGARDVVSGRALEHGVVMRQETIEPERSEPDTALLALGTYLAQPEQSEKPVVPYSTAWDIDKRAGFRKVTYPTDDFLLSDSMGEDVRRYLEARHDAIVVMRADQYERLLGAQRGEELRPGPLFQPSVTKRLLGWLSTTEYVEAEAEHLQKERRWARTVGWYLIRHFVIVRRFDQLLVLERP